MNPLDQAKKGWKRLMESEPGTRFQDRYRRRRRKHRGPLDPSRLLYIAAGLAVMAAGLVMMVAPGPGLATLVLGLGLLGSEFRAIARLLDRGEVQGRRLFEKLQAWWRDASLGAKGAVAAIALLLTLAAAYGLWWLTYGAQLPW